MNNYVVALFVAVDAERDGHADYLTGEIIEFFDDSFAPNFPAYSYLITDESGNPLIAEDGQRNENGDLVVVDRQEDFNV